MASPGSPSQGLRFGTDGVRGVAAVDLTDELVYVAGRAVARVMGADTTYLLARDTRESGPAIERALAAGLVAEGARAESAGVFPTPGLAHLSHTRGLPGAVVSASHNPYHDNGIKLFAAGGRKLSEEVERRIEDEFARLWSDTSRPRLITGDVTVRASSTFDDYFEHLSGALGGRSLGGLPVVVDCAHGAASEVAPAVLRRLGAAVDVLNAEPDGRNINARCGSTHPEELVSVVVERRARAGLAFDGDADRVVAVDEGGQIVDGDQIIALMALDLRGRGALRGDAVAATVMANVGFRRAMEAHAVRVVETPVGDRHVLGAIEREGLSLGGEQSGHVIFGDLATTGDGLLTGLMVLDVIVRTGRALSDLAAVVTKYPQLLRNIDVADLGGLDGARQFWGEVRAVEAELGAAGRVLVRPSGTEAVLRVMVEAATVAQAEAAADRLATAARAVLGEPGG